MDCISIEILSLIASAVASSGPQIDLDKAYDVWGLHDKPKFPGNGKPQENSLAPYAAVSRDWQLAFEPFTFHTLVLSPKRIVQAERQGYLTRRRLKYIRNIAVPITFPLPWPWDVPIVFSQVGEWPPPSEADDFKDRKLVEDDESVDEDEAAWQDVEKVDDDEDMGGYDFYSDEDDELQPPEERGLRNGQQDAISPKGENVFERYGEQEPGPENRIERRLCKVVVFDTTNGV
ncbi:hypothetical protein FPSE5266_09931 [Fusarium pseudograminearum]|nr:hypothetical protein FPSE5266_09931 [Fusarium pseudograminearum]